MQQSIERLDEAHRASPDLVRIFVFDDGTYDTSVQAQLITQAEYDALVAGTKRINDITPVMFTSL